MATHSSILAWRIPWTKEPCRLQLQSMGLQRVNVTERLSLKEHLKRPGLSPWGGEAGAHPVKAGFHPEGNQQDFLVGALE